MAGKAIKGKREKFTLATKCGIVDRNGQRGVDGSSKAVRDACLASLERLQTDHIDLYYLHRVDRSLPIEETFEEFKVCFADNCSSYMHLAMTEALAPQSHGAGQSYCRLHHFKAGAPHAAVSAAVCLYSPGLPAGYVSRLILLCILHRFRRSSWPYLHACFQARTVTFWGHGRRLMAACSRLYERIHDAHGAFPAKLKAAGEIEVCHGPVADMHAVGTQGGGQNQACGHLRGNGRGDQEGTCSHTAVGGAARVVSVDAWC